MNFSGFYGNERAKEYLSAAFARSSFPHALLLTGERGIGKRTLADIVARALVCDGGNDAAPCGACSACMKAKNGTHPDIITLGSDDTTVKVDDIRALKRDALLRPNDGGRKVYIINRAEALTHQAQDAFLKILEEPPVFTFFILLCYNYNDLLPTILSRVAHVALSPLSDGDMRSLIMSRRPSLSDTELKAIIDSGGGTCAFLQDKQDGCAAEIAGNIAFAIASRDELAIFRSISTAEKQKRDGLISVCDELTAIVRDAIALRTGAVTSLLSCADMQCSQALASAFSALSCSRIAELIDEARRGLTQNIGVSHIAGSLICRLSELAV